jgi:predicted amidophosphoribosyltransferase
MLFGWEHRDNRRQQRQHRLAHGLCVSCGYDLRESQSRCPECGRPIPPGHRTRSSVASDLKQVQ